MNRLQKKCFITSAGLHLLLLVILLVGPAFLSSKSTTEDFVIDFIPSQFVDGKSGGGNRNAKPPPAAPAVAQPPPQAQQKPPPEKQREPAPPKVTLKNQKADPESLETKPEPKNRTPQVSTEVVTRKPNTRTPAKKDSSITDNQAKERQLADAKRKAVATAAQRIGESTSSATTIEEYGPGTGGPAYANYAAWVKTKYENAWEAPEDTATDDAITKVTVIILKDGSVLSARITRPSGDSQVDSSVRRTLDRVNFIAPFPEGAKENQRTYIINFNLKAKRGLA
jgi:protein TonB